MNIESRNDLPKLIPDGGIAVELGVAGGEFSEIIIQNSNASIVYSIDRWAGDRLHDNAEYLRACTRLDKFKKRSIILKSTFNDACPKFREELFDFVYIDGYAHTGQEGGGTLKDWWPKLKSGGIFAGHDYHAQWPATVRAVNEFICNELELEFNLTSVDRFHSWWLIKP